MRLDDPFDNLIFPAVPSAQPGQFFIWRKPYSLARLYKSHTTDIQSHDSQLATAKLPVLSPKLPSSCIETQIYISTSKRNNRNHADPPNSKDLYQERNEDPELGSRGADHHGPRRYYPYFHQDWDWECQGTRGCLGSKCRKFQVSLRHVAFLIEGEADGLGNQVISLLRVHDRHRESRTASTMVQPESNHDTQLHRVRLLDRLDSYKLHVGKSV
jgi:hypothetical protein